jgi:predicted RNA-binding Zn ribbon-like protein
MIDTTTHAYNLKRVGGWLCLDFVNTVDWHNSEHPHEWLTKYSDLVSWSRNAGILTENEALNLLRRAELHPSDAKTVLERATILREALYRIFTAIVNHKLSNPSDIAILNAELANAMTQTRLQQTADRHKWSYAFKDNTLDRMLWSAVRSAADLLTSDKLDRIRRCSEEKCGWLFLDMSRNRSRKWCDMKDCGNRTKARRHYKREHMPC